MSRRILSPALLTALLAALATLAGPVAVALATVSPTDDPDAIARAIIASPPQLTGATWQQRPLNIDPSAIATAFGGQPPSTRFPSNGDTFAILSSGNAASADDPNVGSEVTASGCCSDRGDSHDVSELRLDVNVPAKANCLSLDFAFLSEEYPDYVGEYTDAFIAELDTSDWTASGVHVSAPHNFAFDSGGDVASINSHDIATVTTGQAAGTTYNAATARIAATTPISPGAHRIYLSISDNGDGSLDSAAFVDNLQMGFVANPAVNCRAGARAEAPLFQQTGPPSATGPEGSTLRTSGSFSDDSVAPLRLSISPNPGALVDNGDGTWSWSLFAPDDLTLGAITVRAADGFGFADSNSFDAIATNVAPTVTLSPGNDTSTDEGNREHRYAYAISDPGADAIASVETTCGPGHKVGGSDEHTSSAGSFRCVFADGPAAALVTVRVTDDDGGESAVASQLVTVDNVAPTVTLDANAPAAFGEGSVERTFDYTIGDPGHDTIASVATACGEGGREVAGSSRHSNDAGSFACVFGDGPAQPTISVAAKDSDDDTGAAARRQVTVSDVAPLLVLDAANRSSVDEGPAEVAFRYWTQDPGDDTVSVRTSCGEQGAQVAGSEHAGRFECVFADGDATSTVSATPTDSDGLSGAAGAQTVSVHNVAPSVALHGGAARTVDEGPDGRSFHYSISDPGQDSVTVVTTSCGEGGGKAPGSDVSTDTAGSVNCVFADGPASSRVSVSATDSDGATGAVSQQSVTVDDVAPTVTLAADNPLRVDESRAARSYRYAISDPGVDTIASVTTSCGSGGEKLEGSDRNALTTGHFGCVFVTGPAQPQVSAQATDSDGLLGASDTQTVTVDDPTITAAGGEVRGVETAALDRRVARFMDPTPYASAQEYAASIDWGDGSLPKVGAIDKTGPGEFTVAGTHAYARFGTYAVTVRIADVDNPANTDTASTRAMIADAPIHAAGTSITTPVGYDGAVATFTDDADPDGAVADFSATIDWGDGRPPSAGTVRGPDASGRFGVAGSHAYATTGQYVATVTVASAGASSATATSTILAYAFATHNGGSFTVSDKRAVLGEAVMFWGSQWHSANPFLGGGKFNGSFMGYADPPASMAPPRCGDTWHGRTAGSANPPSTVPAFMAVVVASAMEKSGSTVGGDVAQVVVVRTGAGYANDTNHTGTGTVVGKVCD